MIMGAIEQQSGGNGYRGVDPIDIGFDSVTIAAECARCLVIGDFDQISAGFGSLFTSQSQCSVQIAGFGKTVVPDF